MTVRHPGVRTDAEGEVPFKGFEERTQTGNAAPAHDGSCGSRGMLLSVTGDEEREQPTRQQREEVTGSIAHRSRHNSDDELRRALQGVELRR